MASLGLNELTSNLMGSRLCVLSHITMEPWFKSISPCWVTWEVEAVWSIAPEATLCSGRQQAPLVLPSAGREHNRCTAALLYTWGSGYATACPSAAVRTRHAHTAKRTRHSTIHQETQGNTSHWGELKKIPFGEQGNTDNRPGVKYIFVFDCYRAAYLNYKEMRAYRHFYLLLIENGVFLLKFMGKAYLPRLWQTNRLTDRQHWPWQYPSAWERQCSWCFRAYHMCQ